MTLQSRWADMANVVAKLLPNCCQIASVAAAIRELAFPGTMVFHLVLLDDR
jgi:hypothetical protein